MKTILIFFVLLSLNSFSQSIPITFSKSYEEYKLKNYTYEIKNNGLKKVDFYIKYNKSAFFKDGKKWNEISFGNKKYIDYLNFSNDTICYYSKNDSTCKTLFILNEKLKKDTFHIKKFGAILNQYAILEKRCFYSNINDTIYIFKFYKDEKTIQNLFPNITSSGDESNYVFEEISLSKKYGFVSVTYYYFNTKIEIKYW